MTKRIDSDVRRFRQMVRGKIRENLRRYITHGEMIGRQGDDLVSIPVPQLELPHFRYGRNQAGGVGQGDGQPGQPIGRGRDEAGSAAAGSEPGAHILEVEVTLDELADLLGEELQLPRIEPKGQANITQQRPRYDSIRRSGPASLRHFKRTYTQALRRQISTGIYNYHKPRVVLVKDDMRYRSWTRVQQPRANAVVIYLMDVSGSMAHEQKEIVRTEAFWIDAWLRRQYRGLECRYIIHDAAAREVDETTFYRTRENGGTRISSAYQLSDALIQRQFPPAEWNIYVFQFSDGDNWGEDSKQSLRLLEDRLLPVCNLFCYGQVESLYGSGDYLRSLQSHFGSDHATLVLSEIAGKDSIFDSIKTFLGTGK